MEQVECQNCYFTGEPNVHGRCSRCDGNAVISVHVLSVLMDQRYEDLFGEGPSHLRQQF